MTLTREQWWLLYTLGGWMPRRALGLDQEEASQLNLFDALT